MESRPPREATSLESCRFRDGGDSLFIPGGSVFTRSSSVCAGLAGLLPRPRRRRPGRRNRLRSVPHRPLRPGAPRRGQRDSCSAAEPRSCSSRQPSAPPVGSAGTGRSPRPDRKFRRRAGPLRAPLPLGPILARRLKRQELWRPRRQFPVPCPRPNLRRRRKRISRLKRRCGRRGPGPRLGRNSGQCPKRRRSKNIHGRIRR